MRKSIGLMLGILLCALFFTGSSAAEDRRSFERHRGHENGERWDGDIRRFHEHDINRWRAGHWLHGRHAGRFGWWWIVGSIWYFYPTVVYPYPDPYRPPIAAVPPPEAPQYWYSCSNPPGYYPYVPQCTTDWQKVPVNPPPPVGAPPAPPTPQH